MAQNVEHSVKHIKLERLHKSIDDLDAKIKALISKKEELQVQLEQIQQNEIISIVTNLYKTPLELSEFIKQAKINGFVAGTPNNHFTQQQKSKKEMEGVNELLEDEPAKSDSDY